MRFLCILALASIFYISQKTFAGLIFSEVYIDGTAEYIEIYNDGLNFQGNITIEGAKTSSITFSGITISSSGYFVLGDNDDMFQGVSLQKSGLGLNFPDTSSVSLVLTDGLGTILDTFQVDQNLVNQYNDTKTSFQKKNINGVRTISPSVDIYNAIPQYIINPFRISFSTGSSQVGDNSQGGTGTQTSGTGGENPSTGTNQTGDTINPGGTTNGSTTSSYISAPPSDIYEVRIDEIHPGNDDFFKEYIEIYFGSAYSGDLRIAGAGHGTAEKTLSLSVGAKTRIIISGEPLSFPTYIVDGLSLTDGGENLTLIGHNGQVLDTIVYVGQVSKKSLYRGTIGEGGVYIFDTIDEMTPGFIKEQILHLLSSASGYTLPCAIDFQHRVPRYAGTKMNVAGMRNQEIISNSNTQFTCLWKIGTGIISNICNPDYISLSGAILDDMIFEVQYIGETCISRIPLNIPNAGTSNTCSASSAGTSYYADYQLWKEKFYDLLTSVRLLGFDLSTSKLLNLDQRVLSSSLLLTGEAITFSGSISIQAILPNPKGKNAAESVRFTTTGTGIYSGFYIDTQKSITPLSAIDFSQENIVYTTGFGFANTESCIYLKRGNHTIDTLCYPKPKEGVRYTHSGVEFSDDVLRSGSLSLLQLRQKKKEVCIYNDGKEIFCEIYEQSAVDTERLKKKISKLERQQKQQIKKIETVMLRLEKQKNLLAKEKEKKQKIQLAMKDVRQKYKDWRQKKEVIVQQTHQKNKSLASLVSLHDTYISFLEDTFYKQRDGLTDQVFTQFSQTRNMHAYLRKSLQTGTKNKVILSPYLQGSPQELLALARGDISEEIMTTVYPKVYQELMQDIDQIKKNIDQIQQQTKISKQ